MRRLARNVKPLDWVTGAVALGAIIWGSTDAGPDVAATIGVGFLLGHIAQIVSRPNGRK